MAIANPAVIKAANLEAPTGHTVPVTADALTDVEITESLELIVACSGVVANTAAAGFDALFAAIETALDAYIEDDLGIDITGQDVDYIATVKSVAFEASTDIYKNDASRNYKVGLTIQIYTYPVV